MAARELFERIEREGWAGVETWQRDQAEETVHLEFKTAHNRRTVASSDVKNLAKSLSGFANTEGGVLVFGVEATTDRATKIDRVTGIAPIDGLAAFMGDIDARIANCSDPPVPNAHAIRIEETPGSDRGVVVVYVPQSDGGPHQATGATADVNDRFYIRVAAGTVPAPYAILASMFGRRPPPKLRLFVERTGLREVTVSVMNLGRGTARSPYVRLQFQDQHGRVIEVKAVVQQVRALTISSDHRISAFVEHLLYPLDGGGQFIVRVELLMDPRSGGRVFGRIDCEDAQPVMIDGEQIPAEHTPAVTMPADPP